MPPLDLTPGDTHLYLHDFKKINILKPNLLQMWGLNDHVFGISVIACEVNNIS